MTVPRMPLPYLACLATLCSAVAVSLSAAGAWHRGGTLLERTLVAAVAVLLTLAVHQLPAALAVDRRVPRAGWVLWCVCLACVVFGHLAFFVGADGHAGELRAQRHVAPVLVLGTSAPVPAAARPLTLVAAERALVAANAARLEVAVAGCRSCPHQVARLAGLRQKIEALQIEEQEARRSIRDAELARAAADRQAAGREQARLDPVARLVAAVTGGHAETVLLAAQLVAALCLELVGCLLWLRVADLRERVAVAALPEYASPPLTVTDGNDASSEVADLVTAAVRRGDIKPTVAAIRRFVGCSQARAMDIRRQLLTAEAGAPGGPV